MNAEELIEQMCSGKESAFEAFYRQNYDYVFFHAKKYLKNEQDAMDLTQDVFLIVFQQVGQLQNPQAWKSWLGGITYRQAIKKAARQKATVSLAQEGVEALIPPDLSADPGRQLDELETKKLVGQMIDALPTEQRAAVILYYFDGIKIADIAKIMDCPAGTVKSRLNYARKLISHQTQVLEKKHGIKLYSMALPALFAAALQFQRSAGGAEAPALSPALQAAAQTASSAAAGTAESAGSASLGGGAATAAGTTAKAVSVKVIAGILAAVVAVGGGTAAVFHARNNPAIPQSSPAPAPAAESTQPTPSATPDQPAYYSAYLDVVNSLRQYGDGGWDDQVYFGSERLSALSGLCVVRLLDFDGDSREELLVVYGQQNAASYPGDTLYSYSYQVWTSPDGVTASLAGEGQIADGEQSYCPQFTLREGADGILLEEVGEPDVLSEAVQYSTIKNGQWVVSLDLESDPYGDLYLVNGSPVDYHGYEQSIADIDAGRTETPYYLTSWSTVWSEEEAQAAFEQVLEQTRQTIQLLGGLSQTSDEPEESSSLNAAYLKVVEERLEEYGPAVILPSSQYNTPTDDVPALAGLCGVRLVDLDRNGVDELLLVYAPPTSNDPSDTGRLAYRYEVWTSTDGSTAVQVQPTAAGWDLPTSTPYEPYVGIVTTPDKTYLVLPYQGLSAQNPAASNSSFQYLELKNGRLEVVLTADERNNQGLYSLNGETMSGQEFEQEMQSYTQGAEWDRINLTGWSYPLDEAAAGLEEERTTTQQEIDMLGTTEGV